jgi:predicted methyltransferase
LLPVPAAPAPLAAYPWTGPPILAPQYVVPLLEARAAGEETAETSLDLGLSRATVRLTPAGVLLPDTTEGSVVSWEEVARIARAKTGNAGGRCFAVREGRVEEIASYSSQTDRRCSLLATAGAPTMLVSGVQMHRTSGVDPWTDTLTKVRCVAPVVGRVLDTCTGLGYTAIVAAERAAEVVTVELDPGAVEVARQNPWSRPLFEHPRIVRRLGDSAEVVADFPDGAFARVIHDPPAFSLAGDLYAGAFYRQLYRVLGRGGRLFHYVGSAASGSGERVTRGVVRRLQEAGFRRVLARPEAFGVLAHK